MASEEMFENVDDGWTTDTWLLATSIVYYKLTYEPSAQVS